MDTAIVRIANEAKGSTSYHKELEPLIGNHSTLLVFVTSLRNGIASLPVETWLQQAYLAFTDPEQIVKLRTVIEQNLLTDSVETQIEKIDVWLF